MCSAVVICPWGAEGAAASDKDGKVSKCAGIELCRTTIVMNF